MKLDELNKLNEKEFRENLLRVCGSQNWVEMMLKYRPYKDWEYLDGLAELIWFDDCSNQDWLEAFKHHPKIGDKESLKKKFESTRDWAKGEQAGVNSASDEVIQALAEGNAAYEAKFGFIFIVCATGKSALEMLELLQERLNNDPKRELMLAGTEQYKIMRLRLEKLIEE